MNLKSSLVVSCAVLCSIAEAQAQPSANAGGSAAPASSIALTPAVIMVRGKPGESTTQTLTIVNHTAVEIGFHLSTEDVVVRDGKRSFVPAGQIANGIAAGAVATPSA